MSPHRRGQHVHGFTEPQPVRPHSGKTRARIRKIADQIGFEFNSHARSLITRRVGTIGLILPPGYENFGVSFYHATLHNALRSVLESNDFDLIVSFLTNHHTGDDNMRRLVRRRKVDGLIIMQPVLETDTIHFLRSMSMPFVFSHYPPPDRCPAGSTSSTRTTSWGDISPAGISESSAGRRSSA